MVVEVQDDTGPVLRSRTARDREDLNLEISGLEVGRQARFLTGDNSIRAVEDKKRKEDAQRFKSLLQRLLQEDPHYRELYLQVSEKINQAQRAANLALLDLQQRLEICDRKLRQLRETAGTLPDGTRVFRSSDNGIYTEDGRRLNAVEAQGVTIPAGAASWEEYNALRREHHGILDDIDAIDRYREDVLKPAEERLNNEDDPPSLDELEDLNQSVEALKPQALKKWQEAAADQAHPQGTSISVAHGTHSPTELDVPDLRDHFDTARQGSIATAMTLKPSNSQPGLQA